MGEYTTVQKIQWASRAYGPQTDLGYARLTNVHISEIWKTLKEMSAYGQAYCFNVRWAVTGGVIRA